MAAVPKSGTPSISTAAPPTSCSLSGLLAGEDLSAGDACYIKTADGRVWKSTGAAANPAAVVDGFAASDASTGEAVSLYWGVNFRYGANLTANIGTFLFLSGAVPGGLDTATSTGGTVPIARVIDATRVYVQKSY